MSQFDKNAVALWLYKMSAEARTNGWDVRQPSEVLAILAKSLEQA